MKLIVGLGNPGQQYENTRHNIGWLGLDFLAQHWQTDGWRRNAKLDSVVIRLTEPDAILAKPLTMMNNSGYAVRKLLDFYQLGVGDLLLVHDDADLALGEIRLADTSKTGAGHHGVKSVIEHVGPGFRRIRVGIGRPAQPVRDIGSYVLDQLSKTEVVEIEKALKTIPELIKS